MKVGALLRFSTLDYPGKLSSVIFCQGCPLKCVYCHNSNFQNPSAKSNVSIQEIISFLKTRKGLLDTVVFSGGEPLLQPDLEDIILEVKKLGFLIGIHTSGIIPKRFSQILPIIDWVGFDIKTSFSNYEKITQIPNSGIIAKESFNLLVHQHKNFEIRTTFDPRFISNKDLYDIATLLSENKIKTWVLQECILRNTSGNQKLLLPNANIIKELSKYVNIELRKQ